MQFNCRDVEEKQVIERYLEETLSEEESSAFEAHYLGCERCFSELQMRHSVAVEVRRGRLPQESAAVVPKASRWYASPWSWGLAAAGLLLAIMLVLPLLREEVEVATGQGEGQPARAEIVRRLGVVDEAPPFAPLTFRGGAGLALERFNRGMEHYAKEDYTSAIEPLREAVQLDPSHIPAIFYLGISYLMTKQPNDAIPHLVICSTRESTPFREEALWYLSRAYFQTGDVEKGRDQLASLVALGGAYAEDAARDLKLLEQR